MRTLLLAASCLLLASCSPAVKVARHYRSYSTKDYHPPRPTPAPIP